MKKNGVLIRSVAILGTGSYVPEEVVTNEALERQVPTSAAWVEEKLGIHERRIAAPNQATSDLAVEAGRRAIADSNVGPSDIDLIIVATATPDRPSPSTACIVQAGLGAFNAAAFDIGAVCSGFLYGLSVGAQMISAGTVDKVLVIGADMFSRITNWRDRQCVFFGDGAGAAVLGRCSAGDGLFSIDLYADGRGRSKFTVPAGGSENPATAETVQQGLHYFQMDGKAVYETGTTVLPAAIKRLLDACGLSSEDIAYLIPHQPSINILKETARRLDLPFEKVLTNMGTCGNTAGASIPLVLDQANRSGRLQPGALIALAAVGSGWTWGAGVIRWTKPTVTPQDGMER